MLSLIRATRSARLLRPISRTGIQTHTRHFASDVPASTATELGKDSAVTAKDAHVKVEAEASTTNEIVSEAEMHPDDAPLRKPHGVQIDENHGLFAFFRAFQQPDGKWEWMTAQPKSRDTGYSGRSWSAPELRRKSFKDLHTLWYVLVRERNLLATQKEELRRLGVLSISERTDIPWRTHQCRKSMARIKGIINERRLAYEGAVSLFEQDKELAKIGALAPVAKKVIPKANGRTIPGRRQARSQPTPVPVPPPTLSAAPPSA